MKFSIMRKKKKYDTLYCINNFQILSTFIMKELKLCCFPNFQITLRDVSVQKKIKI